MGLGAIFVLLALLVSLIAFVYIVVLTARGWGVLHTILICTLFIECWVFLFFSAGVHYERVRATKDAHKWQRDAALAEQETESKLWGDFSFSAEKQDAVIPLQGQLKRLTADRGRMWRHVEFLQSTASDYQLEVPTPTAAAAVEFVDDAAAPAGAPNSESLPQGLVVYAFSEELVDLETLTDTEESTEIENLTDVEKSLPTTYLGEFVVTQSQAGQVTLQPTRQLFEEQKQHIADGFAGTWTLYELLPLDSHRAFAAPGSQPNDDELFGRPGTKAIETLFADLPDGLREKAIASYSNDGKLASADDPQEALWVRLQLLKNIEVDVDSGDSANATERGYFDPDGRSIDSRIKRKEGEGPVTLDVEASKGDRIVLKEEAARQYTEGLDKSAEVTATYYVRPLVDYEQAFNNYFVRNELLDEQLTLARRVTDDLTAAEQTARELIIFRQSENQALAFDLSHFTQELTLITKLMEEAESGLAAFRAEMSRLYRSVQSLHDQRAAAQASMISVAP